MTAKNFIIITSIFPPTEAVKKFARMNDWQLVVVGDRKTPIDWQYSGVKYLSPEDQKALGFDITNILPWNHYCRKMVGYLYAMSQGAEVIVDTDDDNIPNDDWALLPFTGQYLTITGTDFYNVYNHFTSEFVWPRGYPLNRILESRKVDESPAEASVGVWQFLADEDPDVDAIYRLTRNQPIYFDNNDPIVLGRDTACPFNSQNTGFRQELFALMYLPAFVTFRFTDILRGLVAQPLLWQEGYLLGFGPATVLQKRNPHDYMKDFQSEIPVYLEAGRVIQAVKGVIDPEKTLTQNLLAAYLELYRHEIVTQEEITLIKAWIADIARVKKD